MGSQWAHPLDPMDFSLCGMEGARIEPECGHLKGRPGDFPGDPVVKTPRSQCKGHRFHPWSGNYDPACRVAWPKNKINKIK